MRMLTSNLQLLWMYRYLGLYSKYCAETPESWQDGIII